MSEAAGALPYLDAFPAPSVDLWRAAVDKVLKGGDFEKRLVGRSADGIRIEPLYPAASPALRPRRAETGRWRIAARLDHPDPREANRLALADLEGGADALVLSFAGAPAARGYGLEAEDVAALDAALDGVMLDLITLRLDPAPQARIDALLLAALAERRGLDPAALTVDFGFDPIGALAATGSLAAPWAEIGRRLSDTIGALGARGFAGPFVSVDSRPWHEAGASEAQELGIVFATAIAYLRLMERAGLDLAKARDALAFVLVADTDEFLTVAKFRAARLLWDRVQQACGLAPKPMRLHAETAWRSLTRRDANVNMLRATVATFSAAVGGADTLAVLPYSAALGLPDAFARRLARNTQLVLMEEASLWRVADPAAGAGGFEALTEALCEKGWAAMQAIEAQSRDGLPGIVAALAGGTLQNAIAEQRAARARAIATRREPITGTSEYPLLTEPAVAVTAAAAPEKRKRVEGATAAQGATEVIAALAAGARRQDLLPASGSALTAELLPSIRLAEPFEALRDRADTAAVAGARPCVFLATLGTIADFTGRAGFARNLFEAGGLTAPSGDGFAASGKTDIAALTEAAKAAGTRLACLCGSDAGYEAEAEAAAKALREAGLTVWLAGKPGAAEDTLRNAGVGQFVFAGCDALAVLAQVQAIVLPAEEEAR